MMAAGLSRVDRKFMFRISFQCHLESYGQFNPETKNHLSKSCR